MLVAAVSIGSTASAQPCRPVALHVEPSVFGVATAVGIGVAQRDAVGLSFRACHGDGSESPSLKLGASFLWSLGSWHGLSGGIGGYKLYYAGGGELELAVPYGDDHLGLRLGIEQDNGQILAAGVRWRMRTISLAFDGVVTTKREVVEYMPVFMERRAWHPGAMLGVGIDRDLGRTGVLVAAVSGVVMFGIALAAARASG